MSDIETAARAYVEQAKVVRRLHEQRQRTHDENGSFAYEFDHLDRLFADLEKAVGAAPEEPDERGP